MVSISADILHVAELAYVEVVSAQGAHRPAEHHLAGGLHQALAHHDALPMVGIGALARIGLEHRGVGLLDLQEQRIVVGGHEQRYHAHGADAAHHDHLDRKILRAEGGNGRRGCCDTFPTTERSPRGLLSFRGAGGGTSGEARA
jgi:hypothetical protein